MWRNSNFFDDITDATGAAEHGGNAIGGRARNMPQIICTFARKDMFVPLNVHTALGRGGELAGIANESVVEMNSR